MSKFRHRLKNDPLTTGIGVVFIIVAIGLCFVDMRESVQLIVVPTLLTAGVVAMGLSDRDLGGKDDYDEEL